MDIDSKMPPELNLALVVHGDFACLSGCRRRFQSAFPRVEAWDELFEVSDDSKEQDDSDGQIDLGLEEEPGSMLNYL